ncbi:hypothetical protein AB838_21645 [Rhodobacteraceae bacterium (ex Bugula neritina AB1)]|nr:hypothetical protein AB838_21645 [Rhodobacteraceae bacterium (ex Bugula neritina AB1)]
MTQTSRPQPHRKFIAMIVATAIAVTGFSAAPARADNDAAKILGGLALLGIIGAAIKHSNDRDDHVVTRTHNPPQSHSRGSHSQYGNNRQGGHVKPLPRSVRRYDLPARCVRYFPRYSHNYPLAAKNCLDRNYGYTHKLPRSCKVTFWNGQQHRTGFKPGCLKKHGYRMVNR